MSRAPYLAIGARDGLRLGHGKFVDSMIHDGLWDPYGDQHMGNCAELCAREKRFSREEQDAFSRDSYARARAAQESGLSAREIVAVEVKGRKGPTLVDKDEEPFKADLDKMAGLKPAFEKDGTVTAANASKINDGAAALVLATADEARRRGLRPIARLVSQATFSQAAGVVHHRADRRDPQGARPRRPRGLRHRPLRDQRGLRGRRARLRARARHRPRALNVRGGAVALGHPIGASGARILVTLLDALAERGGRYGCAGICIGGGEATAVVVERLAG